MISSLLSPSRLSYRLLFAFSSLALACLSSCSTESSASKKDSLTTQQVANVGTPTKKKTSAKPAQKKAKPQVVAVASSSASENALWEDRIKQNLDGTRDKHGFPGYRPGSKHMRLRATAYTHYEADHVDYGKKNAIGTRLKHGDIRSAAADWSRFPLGTTFRIRGLPYVFVVDDYGSALVGTNTIDIYTANKPTMNRWGLRTVDVEVIRWGSFSRSADILRARVSHRHCRQMYDTINRKRLGNATY